MLKSDVLKVELATAETHLSRLDGAPAGENKTMKIAADERDIKSLNERIKVAEKDEAAEVEKLNATSQSSSDDSVLDNTELSQAIKNFKITNSFKGIKSGKLSGLEAEVNDELGLAGNEISTKVFEVGVRTKDVTAAPGAVPVNLMPIFPHIFSASIAETLGIKIVDVPPGTSSWAAIETALSAAPRVAGADQVATAATFRVNSLTPKSISARLEYLIETIFAAGDNLEAALRQHISLALSTELDNQVINGNGTAPNLSGLFKALTNPTADATTLTFGHGLEKLSSLIDGLFGSQTSEISQIVGLDTYKLAAKSVSTPASGGAGELTLADYLMLHSGGFRTNSRMPITVSTKQQAIAHRNGIPGIATAVIPSWGKIQIDDPYSNSAKAQNNVTIHAIVGDLAVLQPGAYAQVEYKVS